MGAARELAMKKIEQVAAVALVLLMGLAVYFIWDLREENLRAGASVQDGKRAAGAPPPALVDQSPLKTAQSLARLAANPEERPFAQEALRLTDFDVDLAFAAALSNARQHPPPLSAAAKEIEDRLQKAEKLLTADQQRVTQLTAQVAKASPEKKDTLQLDLDQAQADADLDQDELDDAKGDLFRAGGDLPGRIEALKKEHEETTHGAASAVPTGSAPAEQLGLIHRVQQWMGLHQKQMQIWQAKEKAEANMAALVAQHNALDAKVDAAKENLPELAHHSKKSNLDAGTNRVSAANKSRDDSSALLKSTQQIGEDQKNLSGFDKRIESEKELATVYSQWIDWIVAEQRRVLIKALLGVLIILAIALVALFFTYWMDSLVSRLTMDRRQIQSLHTAVRVSLQFLAVLLILLVVFGPPGQLGTFLGLAGAGLTVALKDFIVSFLGWFVLMGKNGIRLGDWVEINGVTGEVVQVGPFHTVLLETGNWTDSGHPTGRRVTFTNSFAIEGHYFNFSTTGQWLWDELQVILPTGSDPYPMVDAIHKKVIEETKQSTEQAESEWRSATNSQEMSNFSAVPAMSIKPVLGGVEVTVRYITRANERYALRSKLNQAAVGILGGQGGQVETK
jgi:Mechanosensitive ion channel